MYIYKVRFEEDSKNMRIRIINLALEANESISEEGDIVTIICEEESTECVEYELHKAERNDGYCEWTKEEM